MSLAERVARGGGGLATYLDGKTEDETRRLKWDWRFWARPKQLPPPGDWATWVVRAGRGFGKTRTGAGYIHERAMSFPHWIAIVARTPGEARNSVIEGPSGLCKVAPPWERPEYNPSLKRLTWPNGSWATIYSDENPEELRGFSGATAWLDELGKFRNAQACWDMLNYGMREVTTDKPRRIITTTPRPLAVLRAIEAMKTTVVTTGTSYENRSNLAPEYYTDVIEAQAGTRLGRQEVLAEYLDDAEGALWTSDVLDRSRIKKDKMPAFRRIVVAVDPATKVGGEKALTGIVVCGLGVNGDGYVLEDISGRYTPGEWAQAAVDAYKAWKADCIVGEGNQGGAMVEYTIHTADRNVPVKIVYADRSKQARAEPVAALFERKRMHMVGMFPELEDQLRTWEPLRGLPSPDRLDAMVWGATELMISGGNEVFPNVDTALLVDPMAIPSIWQRVAALWVTQDQVAAIWLARDRATETVYLYDELWIPRTSMAVAASAMRQRGVWIPWLFDMRAEKRTEQEGADIAYQITDLGVEMMHAPSDWAVGIEKIMQYINTGSIKVVRTLSKWREQYRTYRRGEDGKLIEGNDQLLRASALLLQHGIPLAITERRAESDRRDAPDLDAGRGSSITGY